MASLKKVLRIVKKESKSKLTRAVITDLLYNRESEQIEYYMQNIVQHGCKPELVSELMFYKGGESFYTMHGSEIMVLYNNFKAQTGAEPLAEVNENTLSWWAYEQVVRDLAKRFCIRP